MQENRTEHRYPPGKIAHFDKVCELYNSLGIAMEQEVEFTINNLLDLHKNIPYKSPVFRANYYSFIFIREGRGNYTTDHHTFEYPPCTVYFTNPGHLKAFEFYELKDGYLITLSEEFLKTNVHENIFEEFPFLLAETIPPQTFSENEFSEIEKIYKQLLLEYAHQSRYKFRIIGNLFVVILLKLKEQFWEDYYPLEEGSRSSQIVKTFKRNLESHFVRLKKDEPSPLIQVRDFANAQHITTSYFNQVIKSKTGRSPSEWIVNKMMTHAKSYLKNSKKTVKEIGYMLGYSEPAHFSNFFKKQSGMSPSQFRLKSRKSS